jgi:hypothetical protein
MNQPVQDGIGNRRISDVIMPVFHRELAGNEGRDIAVTVFDHFEKVSSFRIGQRGQAQIIQDEKMSFGNSLHETAVAAIGPGESDLVEELRRAQIKGSEAFATGLLSQSTGKEGLSHPGRAADQNVLVLSDPVTGQEIHHNRFIDPPGSSVINVLDRGLKLELGLLEETFKAIILLPGPLAIHEDAEAFIEGEILEGGLLYLFFKPLGHPEELHGIEFIEGLFIEHGFGIPFIGNILSPADWHVQAGVKGFEKKHSPKAAGLILS